jgi:drug/metabolite transporter (DMT)-like permease
MMDKMLRTAFTIVGILSLLLAVGFCLQLPWAEWLWPWADSFSPYLFLGSITAATAASLLWIGLSGELGAAAGGALHLVVFYAGLASSLFLLSQQGSDQNLLTGVFLCVAAALVSLAMLLWFRRYPLRDRRPMPLPIRVSFGVFVVVLVLVGCGILLHLPNVFAWKLHPTSSALLGWFFLGAACYFLYGLVHPSWQEAGGQLWAFLAYDLVLIVPYLLHFALARPEQLPSLLVNTLVLVYSAALAIYYLFVKKATRTWRKSSQTPTAQELTMDENFWPNAPVQPAEGDCSSGLQSNEGRSATVMSSYAGGGKSA